MHELSIAQSLVEAIRETAAAHPGARVTKVGVRVGELSGVQPDALQFSFDIIIRDTDLTGTALEIERVGLTQHCGACNKDFPVVEFTLICPDCGAATRTVSGDELQMTYVELE
ncbi:MAG: hydrogenase maturation nickel metallochaperone HypA [Bacteroidales bacterium]